MIEYKSDILSSIANSLWSHRGAESPIFRGWFGSSKATENSAPKTLYASRKAVHTFATNQLSGKPTIDIGIILSPDRSLASLHDDDVEAFHVSVQNPYSPTDSYYTTMRGADAADFRNRLKSSGYDGIAHANGSIVIFDPIQLTIAPDFNVPADRHGRGLKKSDVLVLAQRLTKSWLNSPDIVVVQSVDEMPMKVVIDAAGVFHAGQVFLIADNLVNLDHAEFVLMHESVGHYGLAGLLGNNLDEVMVRIYTDNVNIRESADRWMQINKSTNKALATEEAMADLAGTHLEVKGWDRLVGAFRKGARAIGFQLPMKDVDVSILLSDSRRFVERVRTVSTLDSLLTRYSRASQALSNEFKKWFGKSRVVDSLGNPQIVYHGSSSDIDEFVTTGGTGKTFNTGAFFTSNAANASTYTAGINGGNITSVYLRLENPAVFECAGSNWDRLGRKTKVDLPMVVVSDQEDEDHMAQLTGNTPVLGATKKIKARKTTIGKLFPDEIIFDDDFSSTDDLARWARKTGYDGVIFLNVRDKGPSGIMSNEESEKPCTIYVCFHPWQVKSAIGNSGAFSLDNSSIRYSRSLLQSHDQNQSPAFQDWFNESKVLQDSGAPLVVYHGTPNGNFTEFDTSPMFFTDNHEAAWGYATNRYARDDRDTNIPVVISGYLSIKNPRVFTEAELAELIPGDDGTVEWADFDNVAYELEKEGYDGVIIKGTYDYIGGSGDNTKRGRYDQYVVFNPCQIKCADHNIGLFDPSSPDIRYSRGYNSEPYVQVASNLNGNTQRTELDSPALFSRHKLEPTCD